MTDIKDIEQQEDAENASGPSEISRALSRLKNATIDAAAKRQQLPQPLFWSLFACEIEEIKRCKRQKNLLQEIFGSNKP